MTEEINDCFIKGLVFQTFIAERNILIWQYVGGEQIFLQQQKKYIKDLYSFTQQSAQINFILALAKVFDNPSKKYPTRCILSFLKLLQSNSSKAVQIIETSNTKRLLQENNCPDELINAVTSIDKSLFPKLLSQYYLEKYKGKNFQNDVSILKLLRDKVVAHNEARDELNFNFDVAERLLNFAYEIISIYGMAYHNTIWKIENTSYVKKSAERDAEFIKSNIEALKKK